jgi:hypothetical protein
MLTCLERQRSFATSSSSSSSAERRVGGANDDARCGDDGRYHSHLARRPVGFVVVVVVV